VEYYRKHWRDLALVVLDMIMPEMNGRECFRALRSINPNVNAVLITGYDKNLSVQEILDEGVRGFVQKPFDLNRFSRVIAQALNPVLKPGLAPSRSH
jgi:DNA-binding NtrC family response regulator